MKCTTLLIQYHRSQEFILTFCFSLFVTPFSDREKPALIVHILFFCHMYFFFKFLIKFFVYHLFSTPPIAFKSSFYIRAIIGPLLLKCVANVCYLYIHINFFVFVVGSIFLNFKKLNSSTGIYFLINTYKLEKREEGNVHCPALP